MLFFRKKGPAYDGQTLSSWLLLVVFGDFPRNIDEYISWLRT